MGTTDYNQIRLNAKKKNNGFELHVIIDTDNLYQSFTFNNFDFSKSKIDSQDITSLLKIINYIRSLEHTEYSIIKPYNLIGKVKTFTSLDKTKSLIL